MLNFEKFKNRGLVCLDKVNTEKLLEVSEDAKASLAIMLISKHVAPLREEAASWAVKLKEVGEVLEQVCSRSLSLGDRELGYVIPPKEVNL